MYEENPGEIEFWFELAKGSNLFHLARLTLTTFCAEKCSSQRFLGQILNLFLDRFPTAVTKILPPFFMNRPTITSSRFPDRLLGTACSSLFQALDSKDARKCKATAKKRDLGKRGQWLLEPGTDVSMHLVTFPPNR